ncbi:NADH-quinone oxidoreductase subunit H, partial [Enterococcus faecalis]|uniref:NADH-quinone oxidoreductase subunit H n=1 Tax=Enterococcus faecalis TaxID=1351 RepID=UPI00403F84CF
MFKLFQQFLPSLTDSYPTIMMLLALVIDVVLIIAPLLGAVAYLTYAERKVMAAMQMRKGPNVVGPL